MANDSRIRKPSQWIKRRLNRIMLAHRHGLRETCPLNCFLLPICDRCRHAFKAFRTAAPLRRVARAAVLVVNTSDATT